MDKDFLQYYVQQGRGMQVYAGHEYQSGGGFFGRLIKGGIMPLVRKVLPFLKETALDTAGDFVDNMKRGDSFSSAVKKSAKKATKRAIDSIDPLQQQGSGRKRPRVQSNKRKRSKSSKGTKKRRQTATTKRRSRSRSKTRKSKIPAITGPSTTLF